MADSSTPNVIDGVPEPEKETLLSMVERACAEWLDQVNRAGDRVLEPGPAGEWTLRDMQAHINAYYRFVVGELGGTVRPLGEMEGDTGDVQHRNELMHEQDKDLSWEFVSCESAEVHEELMRLIRGWSQEDLRQQMVPWQPWPRWRWIINLTIDHYEEHNLAFRQWLGEA